MAFVGDQVRGKQRRLVAGGGDGALFLDQSEDVRRRVAGVGGGGALLVTRYGGVAEVGFGQDQAVVVEGAHGPGRAPGVCDGGPGLFFLAADGVGLQCRQAGAGLGGGGVAVPGGVAGGGLQLAAVTVEGGLFAGHAAEGGVVRDRGAFVVLDFGSVDAAEVAVLLEGLLGGGRAAGADLDAAVSLALAIGEVLGLGELVLVLGPGHAVQVAVVGLLHRRAAGVVRLQDLGDDVGVEPVQVGLVVRGRSVRRGPDHRVAAAVVRGRCGDVAGFAVGLGVGDADGAAGFGVDAVDAVADQRGHGVGAASGGGAFDAVGQLLSLEGDRGQCDVTGAGVTGAGDRGQPQRGRGAVAGGGELVRQDPGVDRLVGTAGQDRSVDLRQALARPERGRVAVLALGAGCAVPVEGNIGPVLGVAGVEGSAVAQAAFGDGELHLGGGLGVEGAVAQAVFDALEVAAAVIDGRGGGTGVRIDVQTVVVGLLGPVVRHGVAVGVDDGVEVPSPCLLAPGVLVRRRVARFTALVSEHGHGPHGVGLVLAGGPAVHLVAAEIVAGAVRSGDQPVLTVVVPVAQGGVGEFFDLGAVVALQVPLAGSVVLDQDVRLAVEVEDRVVLLPAQVTALVGAVAVAGVVGAGHVAALDVAGLQRPAVADPVGLVVRCRGAAVDGL